MQHYMLLSRNLLYTGLTRAKQLAILVGPTKAIGFTVKRMLDRQRYTALADRLTDETKGKGVPSMDAKRHAWASLEHLNPLLHDLVQLFERSFPGRIRSCYLGGSYSDGTAVGHTSSPNASDMDLFVIFRGMLSEDESATFQRLVAECQRNSPVQVDAQAYSESDLVRPPRKDATQASFVNALIREASVLVAGEDIRADLAPIPFERYVLDVIESGVFHLGIARQRESISYPLVTPLIFPLTYPDPTGEFYGYDVVPARPDAPRGTRVLVALTAWIATLILALETGRHAGQKSQSIQLCQAYLPDDQRVRLAASIYSTCKGAWGYVLPTEAKDREQLRSLCRDTLDLENEYLRLCRTSVLAELQQGGEDEKRQAIRILQSVAYGDDEMIATLRTLEHDTDEEVRRSAAKALKSAVRTF